MDVAKFLVDFIVAVLLTVSKNNLIYRVAPDIRPYFISGIRPVIRFRLPDIRLEKTEDK